jgi:hypothetical protein
MKKIRVWKVLLLSVVTFGIYCTVWLAKRRNEMVKTYDQKIPHWGWFVLPWFAASALLVPAAVAGAVLGLNEEQTVIITLGYVLVAFTIACGVSLWWLWKFARSAQYITNGRITRIWILALWIMVGGVVLLFLQYYFNRAATPSDLKHEKPLRPSKKFVAAAWGSIILVTVASVPLWVLDAQELERGSFVPSTELIRPELKTADIFNEVNKQRQSHQVATLKSESKLVESATRSCKDMEEQKYYDLENPKTGHSGYEYIDEYYISDGQTMEIILAVSNFKAEDVVKEWIKSPDTRDSILSGDYTVAGVATCQYSIDNQFDTIIVLHLSAPAATTEPTESTEPADDSGLRA